MEDTPIPVKEMPRRLARDEDGAIMILTLILSVLLVKATFSVFNVGYMTSERMRLQMVTDAAAYSSAVWQARFLNYCAYSHRAIVANYASIGLITAVESHHPSFKRYHDMKLKLRGGGTIDPDHESWNPTRFMADSILIDPYTDAHDMLLGLGDYAEIPDAREYAEDLSWDIAESQRLLYEYVSRPWETIVPGILEAANRPVNGRIPPQITLADRYLDWMEEQSRDPGILNEHHYLVRKNLLELEPDIRARFDKFTAPPLPKIYDREEPPEDREEQEGFADHDRPRKEDWEAPREPGRVANVGDYCREQYPDETEPIYNDEGDQVGTRPISRQRERNACQSVMVKYNEWVDHTPNPDGDFGEAFNPELQAPPLACGLLSGNERVICRALNNLDKAWVDEHGRGIIRTAERLITNIRATIRDIRDTVSGITALVLKGPDMPVPWLVSRPHWGVGFPDYWETPEPPWSYFPILNQLKDSLYSYNPKAIIVMTNSGELETNQMGQFTTQDGGSGGVYIRGWRLFQIPIPLKDGIRVLRIPWPLISFINDVEIFEGQYSPKYHPGSMTPLKIYSLNSELDARYREPSVYLALQIPRAELVGEDGRGGRLFGAPVLPLTRFVDGLTAVSRAKCVFVPPHSEHSFFRPNLYFPYWDAQLAPIFGGEVDIHSQDTLQVRGRSLLETVVGPRIDRSTQVGYGRLYEESLYERVNY